MWLADPILKRRPVNVTRRLDPMSRTLFLSLRDVVTALGEDGPVLLGCICSFPQMVSPLLRASRDADAVLLLSPGGELANPRAHHLFFELVRSAAEKIGTSRPVVLLPPPVEVLSAGADTNAERVYSLLDAGYTSLTVMARGLNSPELPRSIVETAGPALDHELGLEVLVEPGEEDDAGRVAGALRLLGAETDLFGVWGGGGVGLAALSSEVEPIGCSWREGDEDDELAEALRNTIGSGARMVTVRSVFSRAVIEGLPRAARERLRGKVDEMGSTISLIPEITMELEALSPDALDRVEARLYAEAEELLSLFRLEGTSTWIRDRLAG